MARALKVFAWSDGFHRFVVATSSRTKALEAWGFDRNLFREGFAEEIDGGAGFEDALAAPGAVVEIDVSSGVAKAADRPATGQADKAADEKRRKARAKLERLRSDLADMDSAWAAEAEQDAARLADLETEIEEAAARRSAARARVTAAIDKLRASR